MSWTPKRGYVRHNQQVNHLRLTELHPILDIRSAHKRRNNNSTSNIFAF